jgi:hypothetical protein
MSTVARRSRRASGARSRGGLAPRRLEARTAQRTAAAFGTVAPAVGVIALGVGLFILSHYLSARFDQGTPITHSVNEYLAVWLSIVVVSGVGLAWLGVGMAQTWRSWVVGQRTNRQVPRAARFARTHARRRT